MEAPTLFVKGCKFLQINTHYNIKTNIAISEILVQISIPVSGNNSIVAQFNGRGKQSSFPKREYYFNMIFTPICFQV